MDAPGRDQHQHQGQNTEGDRGLGHAAGLQAHRFEDQEVVAALERFEAVPWPLEQEGIAESEAGVAETLGDDGPMPSDGEDREAESFAELQAAQRPTLDRRARRQRRLDHDVVVRVIADDAQLVLRLQRQAQCLLHPHQILKPTFDHQQVVRLDDRVAMRRDAGQIRSHDVEHLQVEVRAKTCFKQAAAHQRLLRRHPHLAHVPPFDEFGL